MKQIKIIISGGGTGGHIFPAIAIANSLKKKVENIEILFVGAKGKMEMEKVPAAGYKIEGLWISGLQRRLTLKNLSFPFKVISSLFKARKIIREFKPDVAIGVGGYASGPLLRAAIAMNIPCLIQEQNSYPGLTNKILSKKVDKICVAYADMERFFPKEKIFITGNPVRKEVITLEGKKARGLEHFNLSSDKKTLLIIGGSLGALTINESIKNSLNILAENDIQVIWQTGKSFYKKAQEIIKPFEEKGIRAYDFINTMDLAYSVADLVVSRAGAIAISELCLVKKACILVPSPNVAEDHQTKNAIALFNHNAVAIIKDVNSRENLGKEIINIITDNNRLNNLEQNIAKNAYENSADIIADEVLSLIK